MSNIVVSIITSGLANRIKNMVTALRASELYDAKPMVYWPINPELSCSFEDLFDFEIEVIPDSSALKKLYLHRSWKEITHTSYHGHHCDILMIRSWRLLMEAHELSGSELEQDRWIDFEYEKIPEALQLSISKTFASITPNQYVRVQVEEFAKNFDSETVSMSVRSWEDSDERAKLFDINEYFEKIDALPGSAKIFLTADSESILESFKAKYGERILLTPKRSFSGDRGSSIGMEDSFIDLLLLGKNKKMIISYRSTFPEVAWWLGGCEATVEVLGYSKELDDLLETRKSIKASLDLACKNLFYRKFLQAKQILNYRS